MNCVIGYNSMNGAKCLRFYHKNLLVKEFNALELNLPIEISDVLTRYNIGHSFNQEQIDILGLNK